MLRHRRLASFRSQPIVISHESEARLRQAWRLVAASAVAVAGLAFVARTAAVELGETALWPGHPAVLSTHIMSDVGQAAARGEAPNAQTLARLERLAAKEPLTAQPFLIHGAMAARTGDFDRAEKLLSIARQRAPRSAAARYLTPR